jgi:hypothetical protein
MAPVTDLRDTRVLIPRVRRNLDGPHASASAAAANTLSDDEVNALIADALADLILYSGGSNVFGHSLVVSARDSYYMAPTAWQTSEALDEWEISVVVAQAALGYFIHEIKALKTSERIADEGQEWEYSIAASVLTEQIKALQRARDEAIEVLKGRNTISDSYLSFLSVRDATTAALIEPYTDGGSGGGGLSGFIDTRF